MKLSASIKLMLLAAFSVLVVMIPGRWLWAPASALILFIAIVGANPVRLCKMLLPAVPFIIAISALQAILQGEGGTIVAFWLISVTEGGISLAVESGVRMTLLYLAGSAITITTGEGELAGTIERALLPVDRLTGSSVGKDIATMMMLTLAFIPIAREEYNAVIMAQEARGVRFSGPLSALKGMASVALPLLYSLSERADDIAVAMEARCYGLKK